MISNSITSEEAKQKDPADLLEKLDANTEGLSLSEAKERLARFGPNEIPEKKKSPILKFLAYFWGPIPFMIEAAAILSLIMRRWEDFWIIFTLLAVNAVVGFWEEHKADNAIELLKERLALVARVLRDGKWAQIPSRELVPGDIVRIRLGDIIPADIKLINGDYALVDESALTGESLPVEKHISDIAYSGSIIKQGEMDGVVFATGLDSFFGKTTKLVGEAKTESHFQKAVLKIGDYLIFLAIMLVLVIFLVALFRHESMLETLQFALVLSVAAIPAALPAVLSVAMAVGAMALAKKEAIVSKLVAIEEMAGMDVLCSDKTGTITKNELTIGEIRPLAGYTEKDVLLCGALSSREEDKDPIDTAILGKTSAFEDVSGIISRYHVEKFMPFDPVSKRTEAAVTGGENGLFKVTKGAPQVIMSLLPNKDDISKEVDGYVYSFANKGYRTLAVARTGQGDAWEMVGLVALYDPPRDDSADTIRTAQSMGVTVKMVTGDHVAIAKEIADQVGLPANILDASSLSEVREDVAGESAENADGFAQVFPEHKYRIVELLQKRNHIVGMTGDGVNDAPALKKADVGIAVAGATDAAKSSADIVLTQPGLSVIVDAIKESRKIFQRMNNYAIYRISETVRVLFFTTLTIVIFRFYPITALMIVLLAILNDLPIMTIAYDNVKYSDEPEKWNMRILLSIATSLGLLGVIETFGIFYVGLEYFKLSREVLQSFIYLKLSIAGHFLLFMARTRGPFWSVRPALPLLIAVIATQLVATLITVYGIILPPIGWGIALFVWSYCIVVFFVIDAIKVRLYKLLDHTNLIFRR